jgi:hypothetical protein
MSRTDFWRWSATRIEIDHRAREARLRLDRLERLLMLRLTSTRPWPKGLSHPRGLRSFSGEGIQSRPERVDPTGAWRRHSRQLLTEICAAMNRLTVIDGMARPHSTA